MNKPKDNFISTATGLANLKLEVGPSGNLSFRDRDSIIITPTGSLFLDASSSQLAVYDLQSKTCIGAKPSSDLEAHIDIYNARKDVQAIVHTHAHYVTLVAMLGVSIPVHNTMHADYFGAPIAHVPFANHRREGYGVDKYFKNGSVFLLGNHGGVLLFTHQNSEKIVSVMEAFAEVCRLYYEYLVGASLLSIKHTPLPDEEVNGINDYYASHYGKK